MSKKTSEFDRYDRMKKLQKEAELEKRKELGGRKKGGRPRVQQGTLKRRKFQENEDYDEEYNRMKFS